ncbi:hypothetical protein L593_01525 [Salinarchaeum sp. Harcht-Bsk1]|uniref:hypothetical protein n=1 Tax=Salinarchaeum sp. Harcht-Bsk1 TaxID=1333523 RepID=UPI000342495D|nr:hypothetical protein [Salinarchaeum sp. Harcht-Bsk1]AGN00258.1 hypothetical protein L593_01525 [Salinarchaeum sp. Harcht-Bsk1]
MVFLRAGVVIAIFGVLMVAFPEQMLAFQRWRYPEEVLETNPTRIGYVRYGGVAFVAIGAAFVAGAQLGIL